MSMDLKWLDFGRDVAEQDNLEAYFLRTGTYDRIISGDRGLVIGRKGSGKTALMIHSRDNEDSTSMYVVTVSPTHETYVMIDEGLHRLTSRVKNIDATMKHAWLFTILLALLQTVISREDVAVVHEDRELMHIATTKLGYQLIEPFSAFGACLSDWASTTPWALVGRRAQAGPRSASAVPDETGLLEHIRRLVRRVNDRQRKVYVFFDRLDERWDASPLYSAFVQGLLLAVRDLKALKLDLFPVVLMRDEMFEMLATDFQHLDHFRMLIDRIEWDEKTLAQLLARRIAFSVVQRSSDAVCATDQDAWAEVFSPIGTDEGARPASDYMIERTLGRPRDLILFANLAKQAALDKHNERIESTDILAAENHYSRAKYEDLISELSGQFKGVQHVFEEFRNGTRLRSQDDLRLSAVEIILKYDGKISWLPEDETELIKLLFRFGFICYVVDDSASRVRRFVHSGYEPTPFPILEAGTTAVVPMLWNALALSE